MPQSISEGDTGHKSEIQLKGRCCWRKYLARGRWGCPNLFLLMFQEHWSKKGKGKIEEREGLNPCSASIQQSPIPRSSLSRGTVLMATHLFKIISGSNSFTRLGPMCLTDQKRWSPMSKPKEGLADVTEEFLTLGKMNSQILEKKMGNQRIERLKSYQKNTTCRQVLLTLVEWPLSDLQYFFSPLPGMS